MGSSDTTTRGRFRLTNLARTMIDLASVLDDGWLRAAFDSAVRQNRANAQWISRMLTKHGPGRRGVGQLSVLVDEYRQGDEVPDSVLESLGLELAMATGRKPRLHWNILEGVRHIAEVDLAWPKLRVCVDFDGWKTHGTRAAFVRDRARDRELVGLGWTVLRYPWNDVACKPETIVEDLIRILSRATTL